MFRKKGIIGLLIAVALFFVLAYFLTDSWLEARLEDAGTAIIEAKVEFDNVDFSFLDVKITWDRLQVTNPSSTMRNIIETGKCSFDMEFWPLFSGKVIVEDFSVTNIRTNTPRKTDGSIPGAKKSKTGGPDFFESISDRLEDEIKDEPLYRLSQLKGEIDVDSILSILNIQSPDKIVKLEKSFEERFDKWNNRLDTKNYEAKINGIISQVNSIDVNNIKSVDKVLETIKTVEQIKSQSESLVNETVTVKNDFVNDFNATRDSLLQIDDWIKADFQSALSLAKLPEFSTDKIGKILFGREVVDKFNSYMNYAEIARRYKEEYLPKPEKDPSPPRMEGQNIHFTEKNARPKFWIKQIIINGFTESNVFIEGNAFNIVSNQNTIGKPTTFEIGGSSKTGAKVALNGLLNYMGKIPNENFKFKYDGFSMNSTNLIKSRFLPEKIDKGVGSVFTEVDIRGKYIKGTVEFSCNNLIFATSAAEPKNKIEEIILEILMKIDQINFVAKLEGSESNFKFSLDSNLDEMIYNNIKAKISGELEKAKEKLRQEINKQVAKYRAQAEGFINKQKSALEEKVAAITAQVDNYKNLIETKKQELEQKKAELQNQGINKLKGLLKQGN